MNDLYEELGVPRDATPEEIKKAYRHKAKTLHPDAPDGDEDAFKRASRAVAVLSDAAKREQYDRTGKEDTASPEEEENARALEMISKAFSQLFTMAEFNPALHDPLMAAKKITKMQRNEARKAQLQVETTLAKMEKTIKRLRRKGKDVKAGKLSRVLHVLEQAAAAELERAKLEQRVCDRVLAILKEHEYEVDPPIPKPPVGGTFNMNDPAVAQAFKLMREKMNAKKVGT